MSELEEVKLLLGLKNDDDDALISLLLNRAGEIINGLTRTPTRYNYLKIEATVIAYNQRGAEGNKSVNSGGIGQTWVHDVMSKFIRSNMPAQYVIK